jgi:hypothetical protein
MHIKDEVLTKGTFDVKDGTHTRFWEDTWVGDKSLKVKYPNLYNIVRDPHATVSKVMATSPLNISFKRALVDNKLREWLNLVARISNVQLVEGSDYFKWNLTKSGVYRSLYHHLIDTHPPSRHGRIWKMRILLKIKIFLWFLQRGVVLTKDNLARKIRKEVSNVFVAIGMKIPNSSSLTAPLLKRFGESSFLLLI